MLEPLPFLPIEIGCLEKVGDIINDWHLCVEPIDGFLLVVEQAKMTPRLNFENEIDLVDRLRVGCQHGRIDIF